ncbi:S-layer homology domain-containing protein [Phascolarctobacterium succinatutens]|uniref:S-layer homology domain-containing protein n=1 Tax=Phascolarctobacterium succinatutens TaxID=626940 RepID=UPI0026EBF61C|nr:S-layer homology domain-containing protein [Phascolarctobacterium succinatutens]
MAPAMAANPAPDDANKGWNLSVNGAITAGTEVQPGDYVDFNGDQNVSVSKDVKDGVKIVKVELNKDIDVNSVQTNALNSKYNLSVGTAADNGIMPFFVSSTGAFYGAHNKFSVDKDGNVNANSIQTNALNSKYNLSVGTAADNGIMPFFVSSTGAFYAAGNKFSVDKDGKVIAPEAEINKLTAKEGVVGNVVLKNGVFYKNSALRDGELFIGDNDGNYSQITPKSAKLGQVTIDEKGNIAGVNSIQTNALNAKYNLSVGTANENGTVPFFVNSNGAFYAANGKLVVDKDGKLVAPEAELGKVTADEGVIGNVVLKDGVFYKHTALRDGELFVGDADGNYSQITTKGAKLGKVTVAADGKISGVAAGEADTDAVNVSQLKNSAWKLAANGVLTEAEDVKADEYVDFSGDQNVSVSKDAKDGVKAVKVELNKDLVGIESISNGDAKMALNGAAGTAGMINGKGASIYMQDGYTVINSKVAFDQNGKISGVAAGVADTDAVNVSQLKAVGATANMGWNLATNGVATEATNVKPGDFVDFSGDKNINVSHDGTKVQVELNKDIDVNSVQTNALNAKYNLSVGTMAENGIMPFFVNSTGDFYAAHNKFHVDKDGKVTATAGEIGNVVLQNGVYTGHSALRDGELFVGDASGNYSQITTKGAKLGKVTVAEDGKISGVADTDAVNVGQLKEAVEAGNTDTHIKPGEYGVGADNTVNMDVVDKNGNKVDTVTIKDVAKASDVGNVNNIADDIKNGEGHTTVVDAVNNLNNKVGDLQYSKVEKGDIADGDSTTTAIGKLDQKLTDVAATAAKHTKVEGSSNITVTNTAKEGEAANYKVELNKDIDFETVKANSVTTGQTVMNNDGLKVGTDVSLNKDGLKVGDKVSISATAVTAGQTSISNDGLKVNGKTYVSDNGLNANEQKITKVAEGELSATSMDAVNGSQLYATNNHIDRVENQVVNNTNRINKLGSRVNKVGAGAAALAALHPMDFDPDDKLTFSAGYGNYAGENAAAIGAYYRPDEKVMFSVAGTVGNGENMVNAGVSFALDRTNHVSNSRTALAREVIDLRGQLAVMGAKMAKMEKAFGMLDETKTKLFPDVPANHWAYEYIAKLAGNGYIEGYPDGNFGGDRLMTRYEFAAMLYRAIENGAALEEKIIKEFEPELGRIRVDRISGEDGDRDKIERVRVNDTKGERDHYGNKLAK